jgi:predicted PurR-regulated permease PerM
VLLVEVIALLAVLGIILLLVPILTREVPLLQQQLPALLDRLAVNVTPWLAKFGIELTLDVASLKAQLINYLKATEIEVGLLLNFGPRPQVVRRILTNDRKIVNA